MTARLFLLGLLLCGAAACDSGGSTPDDTQNGTGGANDPDDPPGNGGGYEDCGDGYKLQVVKNDHGSEVTCIPVDDDGESDGSMGAGGAGGEAGFGGQGGMHDDGCPDSLSEMEPYSPCLIGGRWVSLERPLEEWVEVAVASIGDGNFEATFTGANTFMNGRSITGTSLPLERTTQEQGLEVTDHIDIDEEGNLVFTSMFDGRENGQETFRRDQ